MKVRTETRRAVFSTVFLFGLLTWLYVIAIQITHPAWISEPLSHINIFPFNVRVDEIGMAAFVASALAFLFLQMTPTRDRRRGDLTVAD